MCSWSCGYYSLSPCTTAVHSFQNIIYTTVFVLFTATCSFVSVQSRYDTVHSPLTKICICATVNVKTMLLDFFFLYISNYQLSSSLSGYRFCYMFLCTCVYKISRFENSTYTKILSGYKNKNVCAYRIRKFVHDSCH